MKTVCLDADAYANIPEITLEDAQSGNGILPFRYIDEKGQMLVRGFQGETEDHICIRVGATPVERIEQMQEAGVKCHHCSDKIPTKEVMYEQDDRKIGMYLCDECFAGLQPKAATRKAMKRIDRTALKTKRKRQRQARRKARHKR